MTDERFEARIARLRATEKVIEEAQFVIETVLDAPTDDLEEALRKYDAAVAAENRIIAKEAKG